MDLSKYLFANGGRAFSGFVPSTNNNATGAAIALDSAYTYGSAGDAFCFVYTPSETANLTDLWLYVASYTGTWGSTDGVLNVEVRKLNNGSGIPGTTLTGSFTFTLDGTTTGWVKKTGISVALTAGTTYYIVIGDADGGASNYVTLNRSYNSAITLPLLLGSAAYTTTNGFSSAGTAFSDSPTVGLTVGSVTVGGASFSAVSVTSSNTNERGVRFKVPENMTFIGAWLPADVPPSGFVLKLYADATAPGGTPLTSLTTDTTASNNANGGRYVFPSSSHYDLVADTWYRVVVDPPSATTIPRTCTVAGNPDSDVTAWNLPLGGNCYYTVESGGAWVDDTTKGFQLGPLCIPNTDTGGGSPVPKAHAYIG